MSSSSETGGKEKSEDSRILPEKLLKSVFIFSFHNKILVLVQRMLLWWRDIMRRAGLSRRSSRIGLTREKQKETRGQISSSR